ncbi:MAG: serine hydrolase domain-containing protein [Polyangiales bacterium]
MKNALVVVASLLVACGGAAPSTPAPEPTTTPANGSPAAPEDPQFAVPHADSPGFGVVQNDDVSYPSPDWPLGKPEAHGLDAAKLDQAASVASGKDSYCFLVIRHGVLVYERYFNGTDASTANLSWSIAKSYSATLVGIALDRGEISSLDQSAADFVSEWKGTDRESITIRNLISMTAGLKWDAFEDYVGLATLAKDNTQFAIDRTLSDAPGAKWVYDNGAVQVLERVFRSATGRTIEEYAKDHLWSKIGSRASWKHDPSGNATAYANVLASCRDHARLGYLYLHHGRWAGEQVVSKAFVDRALSPSQSMNRAYGFLWWLNGETPAKDAMGVAWPGRMVPFAPPDLFAARGFGNQFVDVIPSKDLIVVRFGKDPETGFDPIALAADSRFGTHDEILAPVLAAITD